MAKRRDSLQYESELSWFILVSALDVFMTYVILRYSSEGRTQNVMFESNMLAQWILKRWGMQGMVAFKFLMVAVVAVIAETVGRLRPELGRNLLRLGTLIAGAVVTYSFFLLQKNL